MSEPIDELIRLSAEDDEAQPLDPEPTGPTEPRVVVTNSLMADVVLKASLGDEVFVRLERKPDREERKDPHIRYKSELGYEYILWLEKKYGKKSSSFVLYLSKFSIDELKCLKEAMVEAIDHALPAAEEADRKAIVKFHREKISNKRLFRGVSTISRANGTISTYMQGLRFRPEAIQEVLKSEPTE